MNVKAKSALKYLIAIILLVLIVRHAGTEKILGYLKQISLLNFVLTLAAISLAQIFAARRMQYFFKESGFVLNTRYSIVLYYVGAFYNFLLPGGIGGDAYKVILARRRMDMPAMQGIKLMVADRAAGLCIVMIMMFVMAYFVNLTAVVPYYYLLLAVGLLVTLIGYMVFPKLLLKQKPITMIKALPYSFASQACWIIALMSIWNSIGNGKYLVEYIIFYSAASIVGLLPVSVGGLGLKEMTYYYGAGMMQHFAGIDVNPDVGIAISLCLFAMGFISSLPGLIFLEKVEHIHHLHG
jgi:uncharacterized membrane protein YbhN (UPF0104 family)